MKLSLFHIFCTTIIIIGYSCAPYIVPGETASVQSLQDTLSVSRDTLPTDTLKKVTVADTMDTNEETQLIIDACDNYLTLFPQSMKNGEVRSIKAAAFFNSSRFDQTIAECQKILSRGDNDTIMYKAVELTARAYFSKNQFVRAEEWYRRLYKESRARKDSTRAMGKIAESIFRSAQEYERAGNYDLAAREYMRVATTTPSSTIIDRALMSAGKAFEEIGAYTEAEAAYEELRKDHAHSPLASEALFSQAQLLEKGEEWSQAAETYLRVLANYPKAPFTSIALFNAGVCFEQAKRYEEAGAAFQRYGLVYSDQEDAPKVMERAVELYDKARSWEKVIETADAYASQFSDRKNIRIKLLTFAGKACLEIGKTSVAVNTFKRALRFFGQLSSPTYTARYYAAFAQFSLAQIEHREMNTLVLDAQDKQYSAIIKKKSVTLENAISRYTEVIPFGVPELTTRSIFAMGKSYEDFGTALLSQKRDSTQSLPEAVSLELGIARAVEELFIKKALRYHLRNIAYQDLDSAASFYSKKSLDKILYLPYKTGEIYLMIAEISRETAAEENQSTTQRVAIKLEQLQNTVPLLEKAVSYFQQTIALSDSLNIENNYELQSRRILTKVNYTVGNTYFDVSATARSAPIPEAFSPYERFIYKRKILTQITAYEQQAQQYYFATIAICKMEDTLAVLCKEARQKIAQLLFTQARCQDILALEALYTPPYPEELDSAETEEYQIQFQQWAQTFRRTADSVYTDVDLLAEKGQVEGPYVLHSQVRLLQLYPDYALTDTTYDGNDILRKSAQDTAYIFPYIPNFPEPIILKEQTVEKESPSAPKELIEE